MGKISVYYATWRIFYSSVMMKSLILFAFFAFVVVGDVILDPWINYKVAFNKSYHSVEDELRRNIFLASKDEIDRHNLDFASGRHSIWLRLNQFSDMVRNSWLIDKYMLFNFNQD